MKRVAKIAGAGPLTDFEVGQRVMTVEGYPGTVDDVHEGPADLTTVFVTLDNGMGGGEYAEAELTHLTQQQASSQAAIVEAGVEHTAADDYPELGTILSDRLPPALQARVAAKQATDEAIHWGDAEREDTESGDDEDQHTALYLPPVPKSEQRASTTDIPESQRAGYAEGFEQGKAAITREPSQPGDQEFMAGYDLGWAEGVTVAREPANSWDIEDLGMDQTADVPSTIPSAFGPTTATFLGLPAALQSEAGEVLDWINQNTQPGSVYSVDWCRFRRNSHCWLPKGLNEEASRRAGYAVWVPEDRGYCWRSAWETQEKCPTGMPGPRVDNGFTDATVPWEQGGQRNGVPDASWEGDADTYTIDTVPGGILSSVQHEAAQAACPICGDTMMSQVAGMTCLYCGTIVPNVSADLIPGPITEMGEVVDVHERFASVIPLPSDHEFEPNPDEPHLCFTCGAWRYSHAGEKPVQVAAALAPHEFVPMPPANTVCAVCDVWRHDTSMHPDEAPMGVAASLSVISAFEFTASWKDVREKAKRIRSAGGVRLVAAQDNVVVGHIKGDTGVYETEIVSFPGKRNAASWSCGCKWSSYSWGRSGPWKKFEGRMCSHALALQYEAQSRGMNGKTITLDEKQPSWMKDQKIQHSSMRHVAGPLDDGLRSRLRSASTLEQAAQIMLTLARREEPQTLRDIQTLAASNHGEMVGLDFRLKSEGSLLRKMRSEATLFRNPGEAAMNMSDTLRFTVLFTPENYTQDTQDMLNGLRARGYKTRVKNYWQRGDAYNGVNVALTTPSGHPVELQFHTEESFSVKEKVVHPIYEKWRVESDPNKKAILGYQMREEFDAVGRPKNALAISDLKRQPFTPYKDIQWFPRAAALVDGDAYRYLALHYIDGDPDTPDEVYAVLRVTDSSSEVWEDGQWLDDPEFGRYAFLGDPTSEEISAEEATSLISVLSAARVEHHHPVEAQVDDEVPAHEVAAQMMSEGAKYAEVRKMLLSAGVEAPAKVVSSLRSRAFKARVDGEFVDIDIDADGFHDETGLPVDPAKIEFPKWHPTLGLDPADEKVLIEAALDWDIPGSRHPFVREAAKSQWQKTPLGNSYRTSLTTSSGEVVYLTLRSYYDAIEAFTERESSVSNGKTRVGGMSVWLSPFGAKNREVHDLFVKEEYRRQGIASAMFDLAKEGYPDLQHAEALSDDGKAFSRGHPASLRTTAGEYDTIERTVTLEGTTFVLSYDPVRPYTKGGPRSIAAHAGAREAGYLLWDSRNIITDVGVQPQYQRKGLATAMLALAREIVPDLQHSHALLPDGKAWMEAVGSLSTEAMPVGPPPSGIRYLVTSNRPKNPTSVYCMLGAVLNGSLIGTLTWGIQGRQIQKVWVDPQYRRRRIAEAMLERAKVFDPSITHHPDRSNAGDAWARAVSPDTSEREHNTVEDSADSPPGWTVMERFTVDEPRDWVMDITDPHNPVQLAQPLSVAATLHEAAGPSVLFHYTSEMHLPAILQSGHLRLTDSNIEISGAGPGVVWLTTTPTAEGNGVYDFKSAVKITLSARMLGSSLHHWPEWSREQGIADYWYDALASAAGPGADPATWWVCTREIPISMVESIEVNGKPYDFTSGYFASKSAGLSATGSIRDYMKMTIDMRETMRGKMIPVDWKFNGIDEIIATHGQAFRKISKDLPEGVDRGPMGDCYANALAAARENPNLTYVEGYAQTSFMPIKHAWVVDSSGTVYDPTWEHGTGTEYFGVPLETSFVTRVVTSQGYYSVFGGDFPSKELERFIKEGLPSNAIRRIGVLTNHEAAVVDDAVALLEQGWADGEVPEQRVIWYAPTPEGQAYAANDEQMMTTDSKAWSQAVAAKEPQVEVSGVVLRAADTGRILMLQRALTDDDDNGGKWEFPGGHHEDGDTTSLHAAIREWEEEVGQHFPEGGVVQHTWVSEDGIYCGHVVEIPEEAMLALHVDRVVDNPDEDGFEQAAWWDPEDARKNPALREECKAAPWSKIKTPTPKEGAKMDIADEFGSLFDDAAAGITPQASIQPTALHHEATDWGFDLPYDNSPGVVWASPNDPHPGLGHQMVPGFEGYHEVPVTTLDDDPEAALPVTYGEDEDQMAQRLSAALNAPRRAPAPQESDEERGRRLLAYVDASLSGLPVSGPNPFAHIQAGQDDNEMAAAAQNFLATKTALKSYDPMERQAIIDEGQDVRAGNLDRLDIAGTHYEALAATSSVPEDEDLTFLDGDPNLMD